ncbi:FAD-binding and (Fe-S)-binding domain-containing protein [Paraburkholderia pallida]|uniref:D-lactate dehydrogenase (cytochrome) n=1 Tax=Paraburkholderia pallida TaxID=2547399 RepID=A0A4P7D0Z6_9BURK|nr:FAD-binding and (Fe-S)-binding domain-containing protein [Paraburkholderia pallida]QBR02279.1 FAD-binding oxidoreductase [Paraburkholderia pallida]
MKKLFSVDPTRIGRPEGAATSDAVPEALLNGTPAALKTALENLLGPGRVLHRVVDLVRYASDASPYRLIPQVIVEAHDAGDIAKLLKFCGETGRHATFRAGGTSLNGQAQSDEILIDVRKHFAGIVSIDKGGMRLKARAGTLLAHANVHLSCFGRKLGPDPASANVCTLGGVVSNNSGGMRCRVSQDAYHTVSAMRFVLPSGTQIDTASADAERQFAQCEPELAAGLMQLKAEITADQAFVERIRKKYSIRNTHGLRLDAFLDGDTPLEIFRRLLIGSEGTLGFIADVTFETVPSTPITSVAWLAFPSIDAAIEQVPALVALGAQAVELMVAPALRAAAEAFPGTPEYWRTLAPEAAALLVELGTQDAATLERMEAQVVELCATASVITPPSFTSREEAIELAWFVREGLLGLVGKQRPPGSMLIVEDVCFPPSQLASAARDLQALLRKHGFIPGVAGHAAHGNLHFTLTARLDEEAGRAQYAQFMDELVDLVVNRYDGSLKAEHGTGLNMAPFLEQEWGERATRLMWRVKQLADPRGVLAPNVILTRDKQIHLKGLKTQPGIESTANASLCIECGFCESVCPSRNVTMTPRQRIVVRREMARQPEGSALLRQLQEQYQYDAIQTCAGDGTCALPCPIEINTGELMREFRHASQTAASESAALFVAQRWEGVERASKLALRGARYMGKALGWNAVRGVAGTARLIASSDVVPTVPGPMPKPARALPETRREQADAVYFTACVNRMFGRDPDASDDALSIQEALIAVSKRAGKHLWIPEDIAGTCCASPFGSKGFASARQVMVETVFERLWKWSDAGHLPIVVDAASCTHGLLSGLHEVLSPDMRAQYEQLAIIDSIEWCAGLLPELEVHAPLGKIVIHPTCAMSHLKLTRTLRRVAGHMAREVDIPVGATCCGTAGDRGLLHPELVVSATRDQKAYLDGVQADAYVCANRTCEMGLRHAIGRPYESFVFSLEAATREPG